MFWLRAGLFFRAEPGAGGRAQGRVAVTVPSQLALTSPPLECTQATAVAISSP